jgi:hypothetical protein
MHIAFGRKDGLQVDGYDRRQALFPRRSLPKEQGGQGGDVAQQGQESERDQHPFIRLR